MADCSKTVEFLREWKRMCDAIDNCDDCPLDVITGDELCSVTEAPEDAIASVQKWSNEHPMETWAGKIKELFPDADVCALTANACPGWIFGNGPNRYKQEWDCSADFSPECVICWNGEYKEAKV